MKRFTIALTVLFLTLPITAAAQGIQQLNPWKTTNGALQPINTALGLRIPGLATSTTGCLSVATGGWISANGSACGSGSGSSFSTTSTDYYLSTKSTSNLSEGSNLYYTAARDIQFSTTSATYYLTQFPQPSFSTTSASYFSSVGLAFSTTSTNYWQTTKSTSNLTEGSNLYYTDARVLTAVTTYDKGFFFSTTSALAHLTSLDKGFFFSTTSANAWGLVKGYITGIAWGAITGTLSNQSDLSAALYGKIGTSSAITTNEFLQVTGANTVKSAATSTFFNTASAAVSGLLSSSDWTTFSAKMYPFSTSTLSASSPLTGSFIQVGTGGSLGIQAASAVQNGYLSATDFSLLRTATTTFSSPLSYSLGTNAVTCPTCNTSSASVSSIATTYPVTGGTITTTGTIALAFGTTTTNVWSNLQTLTGGIISSASSSFTTLSGVTASTTNLTVSGIQSCSGSSALTTSATGVVACGAITASGGSYPFTPNTYNSLAVSATSSALWLTNAGIGLYASSTLFTQATTTSLFSTNNNSTNASTSAFVLSGVRSAVLTTSVTGVVSGVSTQTCTNQFFRALSAAYAVTCASVSLTADVTGTLGVGNGGTGAATFTGNGILFGRVAGAIGVTASSASSILVTNSVGTPSLSTTLPAFTLGGTITTAGNGTSGVFGIGTASPSATQGLTLATSTLVSAAQFAMAISSSTANASVINVSFETGNQQRFILQQNSSVVLNSTSSYPRDGGKYILDFCQDGTGSRTLTFITPQFLVWLTPEGTTTIRATANTMSSIAMTYDGRVGRYFVRATSTTPDVRACLP